MSTATTTTVKPRSLILRPHEARRLAETGEALVVREVKADRRTHSPQHQGIANPASGQLVYHDGGAWDDAVLSRGYKGDHPIGVCSFGPIGSPLVGKEKWAIGTGDGTSDVNIQVDRKPWFFTVPPEHQKKAIAIGDRREWGRWFTAAQMPPWASCFPRLVHESCAVERAAARIASDPVLSKWAVDESDELAELWRYNHWAWFSLVRNTEHESEAADG